MAVEPRNDNNYRNINPEEVYGVVEVYADRTTDEFEDTSAKKVQSMIELKAADKELDKSGEFKSKQSIGS